MCMGACFRTLHVCTCVRVCVCLRVCMCVHMYLCVYVYVYVQCVYTCEGSSTSIGTAPLLVLLAALEAAEASGAPTASLFASLGCFPSRAATAAICVCVCVCVIVCVCVSVCACLCVCALVLRKLIVGAF